MWCPAHDERNALLTRRLLTAFTYTHTEEETQIKAGEPASKVKCSLVSGCNDVQLVLIGTCLRIPPAPAGLEDLCDQLHGAQGHFFYKFCSNESLIYNRL